VSTNYIYVTNVRYLLDSDIVYLNAEVSGRCRWTQIGGNPVKIDNPDSPNTFYLTTGTIEPVQFKICLVEFEGFCQTVSIFPYDPNNPNQRYELDQPSSSLEPKVNTDDPKEYKLSPEQLYNTIYPLNSSGDGNNFRSKFQPRTPKLVKFDEPTKFNLSAISNGGGTWSVIKGNIELNPNLVSQVVSYWGDTIELKINNAVTPERFDRLRLNTNPQSFLSDKLVPTVYRLDGVFNRFFDSSLDKKNYVYLLEGNRFGDFEPVGTYEYRQYLEDNKPYFVPYRECLIRPIEYRIYLFNKLTNTKTFLFSFTVDLTKQLKLNLINNDAMVGFAGVNYSFNSEVILDYLPVQTIDLDLVFSDEEDLNLAPTRPQSNCD